MAPPLTSPGIVSSKMAKITTAVDISSHKVDYHHHLKDLVPHENIRSAAGYISESLTPEDLEHKRRCPRCRNTRFYENGNPSVCQFHPGHLQFDEWDCCNGPDFNRGCQRAADHLPSHLWDAVPPADWILFTVPPSKSRRFRSVVVLGCELGTSWSGEDELIGLTLLDYFTGELLLHQLVLPTGPMRSPNTPRTGILDEDMAEAKKDGTGIVGRDGARDALLRFVGSRTIIVGHALHKSLAALRLAHTLVVDTAILGQWRGKRGSSSVKVLAERKLGRMIQQDGRDALEEAVVVRDLVHCYVVNVSREARRDASRDGIKESKET